MYTYIIWGRWSGWSGVCIYIDFWGFCFLLSSWVFLPSFSLSPQSLPKSLQSLPKPPKAPMWLHPASILTHLGSILTRLGSILAPSWTLLGSILNHLGPILSHLGSILSHLGSPKLVFGASWLHSHRARSMCFASAPSEIHFGKSWIFSSIWAHHK